MEYNKIEELIDLAEKNNKDISEIVLAVECEEKEKSKAEIWKEMKRTLAVMENAAKKGRKNKKLSASGLSGGDAYRIDHSSIFPGSDLYQEVVTTALATAEVNADMGRIAAAPTAGSSGIVPAVILSIGKKEDCSREELISALFTAAGLGRVVAGQATLAGAAGGCQAECGVGSAMAAGAAVELYGGSPTEVGNAFALALKNLLGLVCDPVAGLVEVPCVKRNGFAASHALTAAGMALSGVESVIPPDEVIEAMTQIGDLLPGSLKETSLAGLAATETGKNIESRLEQK